MSSARYSLDGEYLHAAYKLGEEYAQQIKIDILPSNYHTQKRMQHGALCSTVRGTPIDCRF